jgi:hypothetical protein
MDMDAGNHTGNEGKGNERIVGDRRDKPVVGRFFPAVSPNRALSPSDFREQWIARGMRIQPWNVVFLMCDHFGEAYRDYMRETGGFFHVGSVFVCNQL